MLTWVLQYINFSNTNIRLLELPQKDEYQPQEL